uniref:Mitochondrial fission protein ELM1 n=1 Tax=Kalanchoe fedtschenkoi TaxID=63787 RepID=A0A7N0U736_KALFE
MRPIRPIRLPEPPSGFAPAPEIFEGGGFSVVRRVVVIGNGHPGSENQSLGLVRALGLADKHVLYRVTRPRGGINEWFLWLPVSLHKVLDYILTQIGGYSRRVLTNRGRRLVPSSLMENSGGVGLSTILEANVKRIVTMAHETYEKEGPILMVASGRDTISIASSIRRLAREKVFLVQIQHPRSHLERFDLVIAPHHDYYPLTREAQEQVPRFIRRWITPREPPSKNVVLTIGALHHIDSAALRNAAISWNEEFSPLPKPLIVVNIGGPTRNCKYGVDLAKQLATHLQNIIASCGSIRMTFTARTPKKVSNFLSKELGNNPKVYIWNGEEPNPHMGHLAWADAFIITADSVSMLSEACSTGKPVYVMGGERCKWKIADFHKTLKQRGMTRPFMGCEDVSSKFCLIGI